MAFTLTIAVKVTGILVEQWPALTRSPSQQTELASGQPTAKPSLKPFAKTRRRHPRIARVPTVLKVQPPSAKQADTDEITLGQAVH